MNKQDALEIVSECGALLDGHFVGTQEVPSFPGVKGHGDHMSAYLDGRVLVTYPWAIELLARGIADLLAPHNIEVIVGMPIGAYTLGHEVAKRLSVRFAMPEKIGSGIAIDRPAFRGVVRGKRIGLVEDTVHIGYTLMQGVAGVAACGGDPVAIGVNFDRGRVDPTSFGIPYLPLISQPLSALSLAECQSQGQCAAGVPINRTPGHGKDLEQLVSRGLVSGSFTFV